MFTSVSTAQTSLALLALHALGTSAHYLPPQIKPRDDSSYRMKTYGTGYKSATSSNGISGLTIEGDDTIYSVDILLGGYEVSVQLDTGSTDLWVLAPEGSIKTTNVTDIEAPLAYGTGNLTGHITFADFQLGPYKVPNQAFVNATETASFDVMFQRDIFGILGLGFIERTPDFVPSVINAQLERAYGNESTLGESVIANIYSQNASLPNYFDIHIGRSSDLEDVSEGLFSIGEHVPGYEAVETKPKLPRVSSGRWGVPLDGFELNGKTVPFQNTSVVPGAPEGKLVAVLDTGATLALVPPYLVNEIYNSIPGSIFDDSLQQWIVPCDGTANLTVIMGGEPIPIHPLDITRVITIEIPLNNTNTNVTVCLNSWSAFDLPPSFTGLDLLMGDAFLRNVYASYDFGDQGTEDNSFIQLLPTTDSSTAFAEFASLRAAALAGLPPAYAPADLLRWLEADNSTSTTTATPTTGAASVTSTARTSQPTASAGSGDDDDETSAIGSAVRLSDGTDGTASGILDKWGPVVVGLLAANLVVTLILCIIGISMCIQRRKSYRVKNTVSYGPVLTRERDATEYSDSFLAKDHDRS